METWKIVLAGIIVLLFFVPDVIRYFRFKRVAKKHKIAKKEREGDLDKMLEDAKNSDANDLRKNIQGTSVKKPNTNHTNKNNTNKNKSQNRGSGNAGQGNSGHYNRSHHNGFQ